MSWAANRPHAPVASAAPVVVEGTAEEVPAAEREYVGLVTRTAAFAVDGAIVNAVALLVAAAVALFFSVFSLPKEVRTITAAVGGAIYLLWTIGYFSVCWWTTGQTIGDRLMKIRVVASNGERLPPRRGVLRYLALWLAALPLFAGILWILVDDRRRGWHDIIARTVVVEAPPAEEEIPPGRRGHPRRPADLR